MREKEVFKEIDGYFGRYSVSNYGMVINNKTRREIAARYSSNHPPVVILSLNGVRTTHFVYMLVAKAFVDNSNSYEYVRFIDGDNRHHRTDNLEWVESED
ncbi:MAG: hypothetical protein K2P65_06870 [Lachnospiraceae bacterium]|nr:hypothetical protein [Lachnospiraceae bacterium]